MVEVVATLAVVAGAAMLLWGQYEMRQALASSERSMAILDDSKSILAAAKELHDRTDRMLDENYRMLGFDPTERREGGLSGR